jgi:hypothetical protein
MNRPCKIRLDEVLAIRDAMNGALSELAAKNVPIASPVMQRLFDAQGLLFARFQLYRSLDVEVTPAQAEGVE